MAAENGQAILAQSGPEAVKQAGDKLQRIAEQAILALEIIAQTTKLAQVEQGQSGITDVIASIVRVAERVRPMMDVAGVDIVLGNLEEGVHLVAGLDQVAFEQVLANAIGNAADSIARRRQEGWAGQGIITVTVVRVEHRVRCLVEDNGAGIADRHLQSAFEPFFSTKPASGMGLGLFLSREIIDRAGGEIALRANDGPGATLVIDLPLHDPQGSS
jgi:signal transduction histidine kinase